MRVRILVLFIMLPAWSWAQLGPGGVGGNEDEVDEGQPVNVLWLRAHDLGLDDMDEVATWSDVSGYGFVAEKGRPGQPGPTYRTDRLNGHPWVHFDLRNFLKVQDDDALDGGTGLAIFVVADYDRSTRNMWDKDHNKTLVCKRKHWNAWSHVPEITKDSTGMQHAYELRFEYDTTSNPDQDSVFVIAYINGNLPDGSGQDVFADPSYTSDPDQPYLIMYNYSGLEGSEGGRVKVNGNTHRHPLRGELNPNGITVGNVIRSTADLYIGAAQLDPPGNYGYSDSFDDPFPEATEQALMEGGIAEIIIYRSGLNPTQVRIIENYLSVKYHVETGSGTRIFSDTTFIHELIGVGTEDGGELHAVSKSGALSLEALPGSLDDSLEYLFAGHDGGAYQEVAEGTASENMLRWDREWKLEKSGSMDVALYFDFIEAGLVMEQVGDYRLLYKATPEASYSQLDLSPRKRFREIYFELSDEELQTGYYTLGHLGEAQSVLPLRDLTSRLKLYPNPATEELRIHFRSGLSGEWSLRIFDSTGRLRERHRWITTGSVENRSLPVRHLPSGLFYLEITGPGGRAVRSFSRQ